MATVDMFDHYVANITTVPGILFVLAVGTKKRLSAISSSDVHLFLCLAQALATNAELMGMNLDDIADRGPGYLKISFYRCFSRTPSYLNRRKYRNSRIVILLPDIAPTRK